MSSIVLLALTLTGAADTPVQGDQVRTAVSRSLPYLAERGSWWIEQKKCVSCHRVGPMIWSLKEAARDGFQVDQEKLAEWTRWSIEASLKKDENGVADGSKNLEGVSQLLLGGTLGVADRQSRATLVGLIVSGQQADGSWKPGGQLPAQKRPLAETMAVSTMWQAIALSRVDGDALAGEARAKALAWLRDPQRDASGQSTEWWAARLLVERRLGDAARAEQLRAGLLRLQNADGGWSWLSGEESDALATGLAIYALGEEGLSGSDEAVNRACQFLITTQREDGSWAVKGTKTAKQKNVEETACYWGTAWAVLGMLRTLPEQAAK